ncbi:retrovirus-related pol polyprotein from transposon TNT 1-94 [Tanacetum coccineum]
MASSFYSLELWCINPSARHWTFRGLPKAQVLRKGSLMFCMCIMQKFNETPIKPNLMVHQSRKTLSVAYGSVRANACRECQWKEMIQVRLKETVSRIRTYNGTEFSNHTLREYYEKVGISHETSVCSGSSTKQNSVSFRKDEIVR